MAESPASTLGVGLLSRVISYLDLPSLPEVSTVNSDFAAAVSRRLQIIESASVLQAIAGQPSVSERVTDCTLHFCQEDLSSVISAINFGQLKHLDLSACQWLDDSAVTGLSHHTGSLEYLDLYWSAAIKSDTALCHLIRANKGLRYLSLSGVKATTDR
ncbi:hypothetical protein FOZ62_012613, partial [Perkinsus olseni]